MVHNGSPRDGRVARDKRDSLDSCIGGCRSEDSGCLS